MHIEIETEDTEARTISAKSGKTYYALEQTALLFSDESRYPKVITITLAMETDKDKRDAVGAIAKGRYTLKDSAYRVNNFGSVSLRIGASTIKPLVAQASRAAA